MARHGTKLTSVQTYAIAHSAQCKLSMAADVPDRNLRFVLGHAFTLNNALYRVAEIEDMSEIEPEMAKKALGTGNNDETAQGDGRTEGQTGSLAGGSVAFDEDDGTRVSKPAKKEVKKPVKIPPIPTKDIEDEEEEEEEMKLEEDDVIDTNEEATLSDEGENNEDDDDDGLGLTRFASASAAPPRMTPSGDSDSEEEDDEPVSPPSLPADVDCETLVKGETDDDLGELYEDLRGCPCHGKQDVKSTGFWEVKGSGRASESEPKKRLAVMRVAT